MSDAEQVAAAEEAMAAVGSAGSTEEVAGGDVEGAGGAEESLPEFRPFTWKDGDKEYQFSKRAELADFMSNRLGKASEASKRAQERAQHFEKRMQELQTKEGSLNEAYAKISKMDEFLRENPGVAERIAKEMQGSSRQSPELDKLLEERIKPIQEKLSEYEKAEQQRQAEARRQQAISRLREQYGDVDDSQLLAELNRLQEVPDDQGEYALYELLYHALRGKTTPAQIEKKFAEKQGQRRPPSVTSTPGRVKSEPDVTKMSRSERAECAIRQLGEG